MNIQTARMASAGGQIQLSTSIAAGPGWKTIRPSPMMPRNSAGTTIQVCGWALYRVDIRAMRPQPSPKANITDPVIIGSEAPDAGPRSRAMARTAPAMSEARMASTGDRVLVLRCGTFMSWPPRMRQDATAVEQGHDATVSDARTGGPHGYLSLIAPTAPSGVRESGDESIALARDRCDEAWVAVVVL